MDQIPLRPAFLSIVVMIAVPLLCTACSVITVADAAVTVAATAVKVGAVAVETTVDVASAGIKAATSTSAEKK